ncbi:hypothetical protein PFISCL1PPCAC_11667, partial [Pristionchus fissidentatus]
FYVNKKFLSGHSPMFKEMFESDDREEISIDHIESESFTKTLNLLHSIDHLINHDNVLGVLEVAHCFGIKSLLTSCEDFMLHSKDIDDLSTRFMHSEIYELERL